MLKYKSIIDEIKYEDSAFEGDQKQSQLPDHLKCGEVFTWLCAGELYGIECQLCEDHPLCPLSEFAQHMEIWHTDWTERNNVEEDFEDDNYKNDCDLAFTSQKSGFIKTKHELTNKNLTIQDQCEEILEPFEQVLIEQDINININTIPINEHASEGKEYFKDVKAKQSQIENKKKRKKYFNLLNTKSKYKINEKSTTTSEITEDERELKCLTKIKDLRTEHKQQIKTKNYGKVLPKCTNLKKKSNKNILAEYSESREKCIKSTRIKKSTKENLTKIKQIKRTLNNIVRDMNDLKDSDQTDHETSENETYKNYYPNITKLKPLKAKYKHNETEKETSEMEIETNKKHNEKSKMEKEQNESVQETSETDNETFKIERINSVDRNKIKSGYENNNESFEQTENSYQITESYSAKNIKFKIGIEEAMSIGKINKINKTSDNETIKLQMSKTKGNATEYETNPQNGNFKKVNTTEVATKLSKNKKERCGSETKQLTDNEVALITNKIEINKLEADLIENELTEHALLERNKTTEGITEYFTPFHEDESFSINNPKLCKNKKVRIGCETKPNEIQMEPYRNATSLSQIKMKQIGNENQLRELIKNETEIKAGIIEYSESLSENESTNSNKTGTHKIEVLHNDTKTTSRVQELRDSGNETYNNEYLLYDDSQRRLKAENYFKNIRKSSTILKANKSKTKIFAKGKETSETLNKDFHFLETRKQADKFVSKNYKNNSKESESQANESENFLSECRTKVDVDATRGTNNETFFKHLKKSREAGKKIGYHLRNSKKQLKSDAKSGEKQYDNETKKIKIEENFQKDNRLSILQESSSNEEHDLPKTRKSLRNSRKRNRNNKETKPKQQVAHENERPDSEVEEGVQLSNQNETIYSEVELNYEEQKENEKGFNEIATHENQMQTELEKTNQKGIKLNGLKRKSETDLYKSNEFKKKLRSYESAFGKILDQQPFKRLRKICHRNNNKETKLNWERRSTTQKALRKRRRGGRSKFSSKIWLSKDRRTSRKCIWQEVDEKFTENFVENANNSDPLEHCVMSLSSIQNSAVKCLDDEVRKKKENSLTDPISFKSNTSNMEAKEKVDGKSLSSLSSTRKEDYGNSTKQTLVTQFFTNKNNKVQGVSNYIESSEHLQKIASSEQLKLPIDCANTDNCPTITTQTLSPPFSPKTEEEHFEFYEPREKLNKQHISHLIKLYHEHPRLWNQSHPEFCEPQVCRKSWQLITDEWNQFCRRKFTTSEVRIRICTLCQRFIQERDRLHLEGEIDESAKFPYYEQMQFLEQQKSLQKRRELYDQQNAKILEIYQHFPILWHISSYKLRKAQEREQAIESISKTLKLFDIHLSAIAVRKRLRSLRKCYRLEKIRHLHAQVEQTHFESVFLHYERMQFMDKHVDPFVCRICGKIFENLQTFRLHLEAESHGSVVAEENETENYLENETMEEEEVRVTKNAKLDINDETSLDNMPECELKEIDTATFTYSPISSHMEQDCFSESENSRDILQRFTPFPSSPLPIIESQSPETSSSNMKEVLNFPLNTPSEPIIDSLHLEDELIEEIMENVANNDSLSLQGLDQFINTVTSCDARQDIDMPANNCVTGNVFLSPKLFPKENIEHPDIVTDQHTIILNLSTIAENFNPLSTCTEKSCIITRPDVGTDQMNDCFQNPVVGSVDLDLLNNENSTAVEHSVIPIDTVIRENIEETLKVLSPYSSFQEELDHEIKEQGDTENLFTPAPIVVNVQCSDFSLDLKLHPEAIETFKRILPDSDNELFSSADISTIPLPDHLIHKMIEVYRKFPQLWNPNHLDFNSRTLRREAWCLLTKEFNSAVEKQISWRTLHRKLTDYVKYYKKLITEQEDYERLANKWAFYEDFRFLDDVIAVNNELQRNVHNRVNNFKIIAIYKTLPQLWDTRHPDYNKRDNKQRNIEIMCNKLEEEQNLQLTTERLKNRLIELRTHYRIAKKQRLKCIKSRQEFSPNNFEYYAALNFLDDHIDPFICDKCKMEFKKHTDYKQHVKRDHAPKLVAKNRQVILDHESSSVAMANICHICGIKFSTRSNLMHHVRRHEGIRDYACSMCPKKFYVSHALKVHIRSHTKECPYTCEKCGMSFVSASKLNQHVKRHVDKRDFQCDFCSKAFYTGFERDRHERRHLNIRDKACPICGKTFVAGSSYYAHLMLHNDTKRFECDKCDMKFAQYAGLYKHKKKYHV